MVEHFQPILTGTLNHFLQFLVESDENSSDTDMEEELRALLKPRSPIRLPIGRMHADEEEDKIKSQR